MFDREIVLENNYVMLRPLQTNDINHLKHFVIKEPDIWKYSLARIERVTDLENYINNAVVNRERQLEYPFIIFDKIKNEYAGCTRFYDINLSYQTTQLGYTWYGKHFQGTHVNKNCKLLLFELAFEKLNFIRVELRADSRNERSIAAMKSIGCVEEGFLRNHLPMPNGDRRTSIVLSILKDEWLNGVREKLKQKINDSAI